MLSGLLVAALLHVPCSGPPAGIDDWIPIDDPDPERLPLALRRLPHTPRAIFQAEKTPWFLLARRVPDTGGFAAAFAADEQLLSKDGVLVPLDEEYLRIRGVEALYLDCEWKQGDVAMKLAGLYASAVDGRLTVLWIAAPPGVLSKALLTELKSCYRSLQSSFEPTASDVYRALLNEHEISFELRSGRGRDIIALEPDPDPPPGERTFHDQIAGAHRRFAAALARTWRDEDRGVTLSLQVYCADQSLGPKVPFVIWLASRLQAFVRKDRDEGDAPVELLHLDGARTHVVSPEEVEHHYGNNRRAPDPGVILETFLPRSPYARACRLRFADKTDGRASLALLVELRAYPRSRSETVTRACVLMLLARASDPADLARLEEGLAFRSEPLTEPPPLAELPR